MDKTWKAQFRPIPISESIIYCTIPKSREKIMEPRYDDDLTVGIANTSPNGKISWHVWITHPRFKYQSKTLFMDSFSMPQPTDCVSFSDHLIAYTHTVLPSHYIWLLPPTIVPRVTLITTMSIVQFINIRLLCYMAFLIHSAMAHVNRWRRHPFFENFGRNSTENFISVDFNVIRRGYFFWQFANHETHIRADKTWLLKNLSGENLSHFKKWLKTFDCSIPEKHKLALLSGVTTIVITTKSLCWYKWS